MYIFISILLDIILIVVAFSVASAYAHLKKQHDILTARNSINNNRIEAMLINKRRYIAELEQKSQAKDISHSYKEHLIDLIEKEKDSVYLIESLTV